MNKWIKNEPLIICWFLIFPQNYNRPPVMALAIPIAVKFLHRGNKELCRNMSNYLSLAAITKADLLADHTEVIVKSILQGMVQRLSLGMCFNNHFKVFSWNSYGLWKVRLLSIERYVRFSALPLGGWGTWIRLLELAESGSLHQADEFFGLIRWVACFLSTLRVSFGELCFPCFW